MTPTPPIAGKRILLASAVLALPLLAAFLGCLRWIPRENRQCVRWRFTALGGPSFGGDDWGDHRGVDDEGSWSGRLSHLSGYLEVSVPVDPGLPWHRKISQEFRVAKIVPYRDGLIHGPVRRLDTAGNDTEIVQYRDGVRSGIECRFDSDGGLDALSARRADVAHGPSLSFWTNGQLSSASVFVHGESSGYARRWFPTGEPESEGRFAGGHPTGRHTVWDHGKGYKSHETLYADDGTPQSTTVWASDGTVLGTGTYRNGRPWDGWFLESGKGHSFLARYTSGERQRY